MKSMERSSCGHLKWELHKDPSAPMTAAMDTSSRETRVYTTPRAHMGARSHCSCIQQAMPTPPVFSLTLS